jgi:hypothetical protein
MECSCIPGVAAERGGTCTQRPSLPCPGLLGQGQSSPGTGPWALDTPSRAYGCLMVPMVPTLSARTSRKALGLLQLPGWEE